MARRVSLNELRSQVRYRSDMVNSQFITDAELDDYINSSTAELYDILIQKFGNDYYLSSSTTALVNGTAAYDLPDDFYKLVGVDYQLSSSDSIALKQFNFNERNLSDNINLYYRDLRYRLRGSQILFTPVPATTDNFVLWYIKNPVKLEQIAVTSTAEAATTVYTVSSHNFVADVVNKGSDFTPAGFNVEQTVTAVTATTITTDLDSSALTITVDGNLNSTFDGVSGWEEYIVIDAAIKCLQKEESDVSVLMSQKSAIAKRIEAAAENRDAGEPSKVTDVSNYESFSIY